MTPPMKPYAIVDWPAIRRHRWTSNHGQPTVWIELTEAVSFIPHPSPDLQLVNVQDAIDRGQWLKVQQP